MGKELWLFVVMVGAFFLVVLADVAWSVWRVWRDVRKLAAQVRDYRESRIGGRDVL